MSVCGLSNDAGYGDWCHKLRGHAGPCYVREEGMSEKLIDHDYENHHERRGVSCEMAELCHRLVSNQVKCGKPRSRHRQSEKAQDFGEREGLTQPAIAACVRHGRTVFGECPACLLVRAEDRAWSAQQDLLNHPALAACAGADSPQPGELASLRDDRLRGLKIGYAVTPDCQSVEEMAACLVEMVRGERAVADALRTRLEGLESEYRSYKFDDYTRTHLTADRLAAILAETRVTEPSQAERQLAQALLVLKACRFVGYPACGNIVSYDTTISDGLVIAAFEALRKDGLL